MKDYAHISDAALIAALRCDDPMAFEELFSRYYPVLTAFCKGMLKDEEAAKDVAQDTFVSLWLTRRGLVPEKSVRSLLFVIARRKILDILKSARKRATMPTAAGVHVSAPESVQDYIDSAETGRILFDGIVSLPEQRRKVFSLSRYGHLSNAEIAERLGISVRTVEKHISLALKELRNRLS